MQTFQLDAIWAFLYHYPITATIKLSHITVSPTSFRQQINRLVAYFFGPELQRQTIFMNKYCNRSTSYCSVPLCIAAKGFHCEVYIRHRKPHNTVDDSKVYIHTRANEVIPL